MASVSTHPTDIFSIIENKSLSEAEVLQKLESILKIDPSLLFAQDNGFTPLHLAAMHRSPIVCKLLVEADNSLRAVRAATSLGHLPFHFAIIYGNLETARYLLKVYPESINTLTIDGNYPIHEFAIWASFGVINLEVAEETVKFLLEHDQGAILTANRNGKLPLHCAVDGRAVPLPVVKHLFDAYPGAIRIGNRSGRTLLESERHFNHSEAISYLEGQLNFAQLPLHGALTNLDVSLGALKLMIDANPQSLRSANSQGQLPLHTACSIRDTNVIEFLVEAHPESLQVRDANNNLPLHIVCSGGNFDAINCILERSDHGVDSLGGEKMYPIHLLLLCADCDRDSLAYVDSVGRLLRSNPATLSNMMV